jgi:hypothetical protein
MDPVTAPRPVSWTSTRKAGLIPGAIVLVGVLLATGYAMGTSTMASTGKQLSRERRELAVARTQLTVTQDTLIATRSQLQNARTDASQANANAAAKYASDEAKLRQKERTLLTDEHAVDALKGQIQSSAISADGVYVIGRDIKSGTWHTPGDGGQSDNECYYATLGSTDTSNITDNNNFDGPETVSLSGVDAFQISGPCTWYRTGP